jgi:homoserine kinase type II
MNVLSSDVLASLATEYDIGTVRDHWPAAYGIENTNYFVRTEGPGGIREYVLTIIDPGAGSGAHLIPLLDACVGLGLPVPAPLATRSGTRSITVCGRSAHLCPRLSGRHVFSPDEAQVAALGRFMARLHRGAGSLDLELPPYPRDLEWLTARVRCCRAYLPYRSQALLDDALRETRSLLARLDVAELPQGPIHGDLFRDNVLFNPQGLTGVLDFHHAARGHFVYDLAVAANDWCTDTHGALDPARTLALLRAYHRIRPLAAAELWYFPPFALYGALAFWLSRLATRLQQRRGAAVRVKDPDAFERIVARHRAQHLYLDPRLLE